MDRENIRNLPDDDIIVLITRGNANAFRYLLERYEADVASIVIGMLGNGSDAEDVGQDIFIRVYKGLKNFRFKSAFRTYLTRIAINVCLDEIKRRKKKPVVSSLPECGGESVRDHTLPDYEIREAVIGALLELDSKHRTVVILRMMEGYSTRETSRILHIPEGTVLSRLSRAQKKLQGLLGQFVE